MSRSRSICQLAVCLKMVTFLHRERDSPVDLGLLLLWAEWSPLSSATPSQRSLLLAFFSSDSLWQLWTAGSCWSGIWSLVISQYRRHTAPSAVWRGFFFFFNNYYYYFIIRQETPTPRTSSTRFPFLIFQTIIGDFYLFLVTLRQEAASF